MTQRITTITTQVKDLASGALDKIAGRIQNLGAVSARVARDLTGATVAQDKATKSANAQAIRQELIQRGALGLHKQLTVATKDLGDETAKTTKKQMPFMATMNAMMFASSAASGNLYGMMFSMLFMAKSTVPLAIGLTGVVGAFAALNKSLSATDALQKYQNDLKGVLHTAENTKAAWAWLEGFEPYAPFAKADQVAAARNMLASGLDFRKYFEGIGNIAASAGTELSTVAEVISQIAKTGRGDLGVLQQLGITPAMLQSQGIAIRQAGHGLAGGPPVGPPQIYASPEKLINAITTLGMHGGPMAGGMQQRLDTEIAPNLGVMGNTLTSAFAKMGESIAPEVIRLVRDFTQLIHDSIPSFINFGNALIDIAYWIRASASQGGMLNNIFRTLSNMVKLAWTTMVGFIQAIKQNESLQKIIQWAKEFATEYPEIVIGGIAAAVAAVAKAKFAPLPSLITFTTAAVVLHLAGKDWTPESTGQIAFGVAAVGLLFPIAPKLSIGVALGTIVVAAISTEKQEEIRKNVEDNILSEIFGDVPVLGGLLKVQIAAFEILGEAKTGLGNAIGTWIREGLVSLSESTYLFFTDFMPELANGFITAAANVVASWGELASAFGTWITTSIGWLIANPEEVAKSLQTLAENVFNWFIDRIKSIPPAGEIADAIGSWFVSSLEKKHEELKTLWGKNLALLIVDAFEWAFRHMSPLGAALSFIGLTGPIFDAVREGINNAANRGLEEPNLTPSNPRSPGARGGSVSMTRPAAGSFTQTFGRPPNHKGVDIANDLGTGIYAAESGRVGKAVEGWNGGYGTMAEMFHEGGFSTLYAHLSKLLVNPGDYLSRGSLLGLMGSTGQSTGSHLHFETMKDGMLIDPTSLIGMAKGGIATKPTLALIGESGPEAVVPLNGQNGPGSIVVNVTGNTFVGSDPATSNMIADMASEAILQKLGAASLYTQVLRPR